MRRLFAAAGAVLLIAGCGHSGDAATELAPATAPPGPSSELGSCLVGTWDLDAGFLESMLLESTRTSMESDQLGGTIESINFSAVQTTTFASDGTFSTRVEMSTDMEAEIVDFEGIELPAEYKGYKMPISYDSEGTATGSWTADADSFVTTIEDNDIEGTMVVDSEPVGGSEGFPVVLPDELTPATCDSSVLTISTRTGFDPLLPDELVFTRNE